MVFGNGNIAAVEGQTAKNIAGVRKLNSAGGCSIGDMVGTKVGSPGCSGCPGCPGTVTADIGDSIMTSPIFGVNIGVSAVTINNLKWTKNIIRRI